MTKSISTFLMFEGNAGEAIDLYSSVFEELKVEEIEKYGPNEQGVEGSVRRANLLFGRHSIVCIDSPIAHEFSFTPSISLFVECESEQELKRILEKLSEDGTIRMPLDNYGFSKSFCWLDDCFGVSWQLNLN